MKYLLLPIYLILTVGNANSQESKFSKSGIKVGMGLSLHNSSEETGLGLAYILGYQRSIDESNRLRINTNFTTGSFRPYFISDTREQFYKSSSLSFKIDYDFLRKKSFSFNLTAGPFINYTRGILGTGGPEEAYTSQSIKIDKLYYGGEFSIGFRIDNPSKWYALNFIPYSVQFGNDQFGWFSSRFELDIKLRSKK